MMRHFLSSVVTKAVAGFVVVSALSTLPAQAQAPAPSSGGGALGQGFGEQGQLVISGEDFLGFTKENNAGWRMAIQPSVDYFVAPQISIGGVGAFIMGNNSYRE